MPADEKDLPAKPQAEKPTAPPPPQEPDWSDPKRVPGAISVRVSGPPILDPAEFLRLEDLAPMI